MNTKQRMPVVDTMSTLQLLGLLALSLDAKNQEGESAFVEDHQIAQNRVTRRTRVGKGQV